MTLQEVAKELRLSETTIYKNFKRTQENLRKYDIELTKTGKGENVDYQIRYIQKEN